MKILTNIVKFILIIILTICIISIGLIKIVSSTILDQNYIMQKLEENNFYVDMYELVISNFENYIYQSGLEEEVLQNICTEEKVKKDINVILSNIYKGTTEKIDTTEIANNLNSNIDELGIKNSKNEKAINEFVRKICSEYTDTLIHTKYEQNINGIYNKLIKIIDKLYNGVIMAIIITIIILILINLRGVSKNIQDIGISLFATFTFNLIACNTIVSKVNIKGIKIFNDTFSKSIVSILEEIIESIKSFGIGALLISLLLIFIYVIIEIKKNAKEENKRITTDK